MTLYIRRLTFLDFRECVFYLRIWVVNVTKYSVRGIISSSVYVIMNFTINCLSHNIYRKLSKTMIWNFMFHPLLHHKVKNFQSMNHKLVCLFHLTNYNFCFIDTCPFKLFIKRIF